MVFPNCRDWHSASGPFLPTPVPSLPEALLGNRFAADRGCGSCLGLGCPDLLQSYRELCLLGSMSLLPQDAGLLIKEAILGTGGLLHGGAVPGFSYELPKPGFR